MAAVAGGDRGCFERLYALYERRVLQYARSFLRDRATAEEVVIDTMLSVWESASRFQGTARVSTWIFGIARHKALDAARRVARSADIVPLDEAGAVPAAEPGPEVLAGQVVTGRLVQAALECLSPEQREILWLAFYEDLPYSEIASLLGIPVNTVKTRVFYAKQKLQGVLMRPTPMERVS
jgi:RNA polymerase sigma-70 factor (ECF subfamily)